MRIMQLVFSFTVGGTERLLTDICNEMAAKGHDIFLYVINDHYEPYMLERLDSKVHIHLERRQPKTGGYFQTMGKISTFIKKHHIDVVHCNSTNAPELMLREKLSRRHTKIFYTIHTTSSGIKPMRMLYRNFVCDKMIAISESVKEEILQKGGKESKVKIVHNAIRMDKFDVSVRQMDSEYIVIGNVARLNIQHKGQDILIKALALVKEKYPGIILKFAGEDASEDQRNLHYLQELAKELHVEEQVEFAGNIEDVNRFLDGIDVFVLPSRYEGFGISLLEAMAKGIPVVASNVEGPMEVMKITGVGREFLSEDEHALAKVVGDVISNYDEEKKAATDAVNRIVQMFNIETMCQKMLALYDGKDI